MAASAKKGKLLKEQLELVSYTTFDGRTRHTIKPIDDTLSFDKGFFVFVRALQMLRSKNDGVTMVGLAGPSGSGKTAFSEKIRNFWPGVAVISMDMYNQGDKVVDDNFDDPRITDYKTLLSNMQDLRDGKPTQIPIYDFKTSSRVGYRLQQPPSAQVVIVEGIYALSEQLRPLLDLRVSITGGVHFDLVKRVMRDISRSGQDAEGIIQQITDTVYPMFKVFIEPALQTAQLRITNAFNPFAGFMSPTYMLKSNRVPELSAIRRALEEQGLCVVEKTAVELYDIYLVPPNQDAETCQSWLRMRNKDGRYSLLFEEWVTEGPFIISPRISFEVNVRVMGGLMSLGYEVGAVMRRTSVSLVAQARPPPSRPSVSGADGLSATTPDATAVAAAAASSGAAGVAGVGSTPLPAGMRDPDLSEGAVMTVKVDDVEALGKFITILGKDRGKVAGLGSELGLDGSYIPHSFIEQVQMYRLTNEFAPATADWKRRFVESSTGGPGGVVSAGAAKPDANLAVSGAADRSMSAMMSELMSSPPRKRLPPRTSVPGHDVDAVGVTPSAQDESSTTFRRASLPGPSKCYGLSAGFENIVNARTLGHDDAVGVTPSAQDGSSTTFRRASLPGPSPSSWSKLHWVDSQPAYGAHHPAPGHHQDSLDANRRAPRPTQSEAASAAPHHNERLGGSPTPVSTPVSKALPPAAGGGGLALPPRGSGQGHAGEAQAHERLELLAQRLSDACAAQEAAAGKLLQALEAAEEQRQAAGDRSAWLAGAAAVAAVAFIAGALGARLASRF